MTDRHALAEAANVAHRLLGLAQAMQRAGELRRMLDAELAAAGIAADTPVAIGLRQLIEVAEIGVGRRAEHLARSLPGQGEA